MAVFAHGQEGGDCGKVYVNMSLSHDDNVGLITPDFQNISDYSVDRRRGM